ncbi:hypothetical protein ACFS5L_37550 [Streptomyces phyllanthi]|uniref:Uncharacterized protein n=1 Tax=Streptomyces phyllanthi TaxID=1803180 RepID=A0A5N8W6K7_9ACTN|nr:hypothetical protein [Streptomyces phyllanthi]MPY43120.1 hypothetical protein [Streptomyces phyllanthi]
MTPFPSLAKRLSLALAAVGMAAGLALGSPVTAQAQPNISVSCSAAGLTEFHPGVQLWPRPQQITYKGQPDSCTDNSGFGIREARLTASLQNVWLSCLAGGMGTGTGTATIEWAFDDGTRTSSTVDVSLDHSILNHGSVSGHVRSGLFAGQGFSGEFSTSLWGGAGACTIGIPAGGLTETSFTGQFSVL